MPFSSWIRYIFMWTLLLALPLLVPSSSPLHPGPETARGGERPVGSQYMGGRLSLLRLIERPELWKRASEEPVVLGASADGRYAGMLAPGSDGKSHRLEVRTPGRSDPVVAWVLPELGGNEDRGVLEEQLEWIRGMVAHRYGIRIPARTERIEPGDEVTLSPEKGTKLRVVREAGFDAVFLQLPKRSWMLIRFPARWNIRFDLVRDPGGNGDWLLAATDRNLRAVTLLRADPDRVDSALPDDRILDRCRRLFHEPCRIAWRSGISGGWVLAVSGIEERVREVGAYHATSESFAVFSSNGALLLHGGNRGVSGQGTWLPTGRKAVSRYRLDIIPASDGDTLYFLVDALDSGDGILRTMEWEWNMKTGKWNRVGGGSR